MITIAYVDGADNYMIVTRTKKFSIRSRQAGEGSTMTATKNNAYHDFVTLSLVAVLSNIQPRQLLHPIKVTNGVIPEPKSQTSLIA